MSTTYTLANINLLSLRLSCQKQDSSMYSDEHHPADPINLGSLLAQCSAGWPRGIGLISGGLYCSDILNKWIHAWSSLSLSIPSLIWSPYSSPASFYLSVALVKRHAFIKCLLFQLFSSHVIPLLNYNPRPPPLSHPPSPTGSPCLYSAHTGSIACNVFCHVICNCLTNVIMCNQIPACFCGALSGEDTAM